VFLATSVQGAKSTAGKPSDCGEGQTFDAVLLLLLVFAAVNVYRHIDRRRYRSGRRQPHIIRIG
jgi:hypothetical protein